MRLFHAIDFYLDLNKYLFRFYFQKKEELFSIRNMQFKQIIRYAYTKVPFYRNSILKHKIDLGKIGGLDQISEFPVMGPEDIFLKQGHTENDIRNKPITLRSSGTTGAPKDVRLSYFDWFCLRRLAYLRMFFTSGCSVLHKTLFLSSQRPYPSIKLKWFQRLGAMRARSISADKPGPEIADFFNRYRPDVFHCLTADGVILADLVRRSTRYAHRAKYLFTSGEILTEKDKQEMIDNLGENVIDFYATTEAGILAWQCGKTGAYHINADQIYVEILNGERACNDGEVGEVVLTTLAPFSLPLIRYRTGDMAAIEHERCKCGSWFPRLTHIKGRKNDFLVNTKRENISPYLLMVIMDKFTDVLKYRICQNTLTEYVIYVRLKKHLGSETVIREKISRAYNKIFGLGSKVSVVDLTDSHLADIGLKQKTVVSYVKTK